MTSRAYFLFTGLLLMAACHSTSSTSKAGSAQPTPRDWRIGQPSEPAAFWLAAAGNANNSIEVRRICILELFRRHVRAGMSLNEIARLVPQPAWFPNKFILDKSTGSGYLPLDPIQTDNLWAIIVLPAEKWPQNCSYICLRLPSGLTRDEVGAALRGEPTSERVANTKIKQIGFAEYN